MKIKFLLFAVSIFSFIQGKSQSQVSFQYTGSVQNYTFAGSACVIIEAWGGGGGSGGADVAGPGGNGGGGAFAGESISVNAGDVLQIYTGGGGTYGISGDGNGTQGYGGWGYGSGGNGGYAGYSGSSGGGAGGGGSSTVLLNGNVIVVAAGGGGGGGSGCSNPGASGGAGGQAGQEAPPFYNQDGAFNYSNVPNGAPGVDRGSGDGGGGGGGGGGWNGGMGGGVTSQGGTDCNYGGGAASGGGGNSFGAHIFNGLGATPGNNTDPGLCATCAAGSTNANTNGGNGLVVLVMSNVSFPHNFNYNSPLCSGGTLSFSTPDSTSAISFSWSGPGGFTSYYPNPSINNVTIGNSGEYTVIIRDSLGCYDTLSADIVVDSGFMAGILPPDTLSCRITKVALEAGSSIQGSSYNWGAGITTKIDSVTFPGTYTVTVTAPGGCTETASATVYLDNMGGSSPASITVQPPSGNVCQGDSVILTASAGSSYEWSNSAVTRSTVVRQSNTYSVTVTQASGCTASASQLITISNNPAPVISSSGATTFCQGGSVNLDVGNYATYLWNTGATNSSVTASQSGNYSVAVTDANGCSGSASQLVTVNSNPVPSITPNSATTFCQGDSVSLDAGSYNSYIWNNADTTRSVTTTASGNYILTVTEAGCTGTASQVVTVNSNPSPYITPNGTTTFCQGGSVSLDAGSYASYIWINNYTTQSITVTAPANYTVMVTDANGCTGSASFVVTVNPLPVLQAIQIDSTSCGLSNGSAIVNVENINGGYTYLWNNNATDSLLTGIPGGIYTVTVTSSFGCSASASAMVASSQAIAPVNINANKLKICPDDSAQLCVTGEYASYVWSIGNITSCIYVYNAGDYYVTATNQNNCSAESNHLTINAYPSPPVLISVSGDTLFGFDAFKYQWLFNDTVIPGATSSKYVATQSGFYTLQITDTNGCSENSEPDHIILTGIETLLGNDWLKVFPNPSATGTWQLAVSEGLTGSRLEIFDASGKIVYKDEIGNTITELSPQLPDGVYLLQIKSGDKIAGVKLVKF